MYKTKHPSERRNYLANPNIPTLSISSLSFSPNSIT
jgi:hypothetical protein